MARALPILSTPLALEQLDIASPCSATWEDMRPLVDGDDRVRHCGLCDKNVYNLAGMTRREATALVADREGSICLRMYRRADGTVLTSDCPVGVRAALVAAQRRARRELAWAAAATVAAVGALLAFLGASVPRRTCASDPGVPAVASPSTTTDLPRMGAVAPPPDLRPVMGEMAAIPPSALEPPTPSPTRTPPPAGPALMGKPARR
jgi:hypothetical protein